MVYVFRRQSFEDRGLAGVVQAEKEQAQLALGGGAELPQNRQKTLKIRQIKEQGRKNKIIMEENAICYRRFLTMIK